MDVKSPFAGTISAIFAEAGAEVEVGKTLFDIIKGSAPAKATPAAAANAAPAAASSPAASAPAATKATPPATKASPSSSASNAGVVDRSETRVKMTRMRLRIAQRLKEAQGTAAMLTTFQECDMGNLMEMRNKYKDQFEKVHGVKLGFMSAFVKVILTILCFAIIYSFHFYLFILQASTMALQEVPAINAMIDDSTNEIVYRNYCDVSVAVASPTGLVVPVLRNTENMSFAVRFLLNILFRMCFNYFFADIAIWRCRTWRRPSECMERRRKMEIWLWKKWPVALLLFLMEGCLDHFSAPL